MVTATPETIVLGRIAGIFGVRGWLKVESWTDPRESIFDYASWQLSRPDSDASQTITPLEGRPQGKSLVFRLPGIDSPEQAQTLVGMQVSVPREQLPQLDAGEYYWADLEGLAVINADGTDFGRVSHLLATGANDVLVVQGDRERLIPFLQPDVICEVDLKAGRIRVDWDPEF